MNQKIILSDLESERQKLHVHSYMWILNFDVYMYVKKGYKCGCRFGSLDRRPGESGKPEVLQ